MKFIGFKKIIKYIVLPLSLVVILGVVGVSAYAGVNYLQSSNLAAEGKSLLVAEKYDQAIEKYALAMSKWVPEKFKNSYTQGLEQAQKLQTEVEAYEKGIEYYDEEKWVEAKQKLEQISEGSKYYSDAKEKINNIGDKLVQAEEEKKKIQVKKTVVPIVASTATPAPTSNPNKDSICRNEAEMYKISEKEKAVAYFIRQAPQVLWSGNDWIAHGYSQADLQYVIPSTQNIYRQALAEMDKQAQQAYLKKYNECLQK